MQHTPWCNGDWWSTSNLTPRGYRPLRDTDITRLGNFLTAEFDYGDCSLTACRVAINAVASDQEFDELKDWLYALPEWDGVARLDSWLAVYCGADIEAHTSEYLAMASSKYIMQVLNRGLNPGAKADYALVLTSSQGSGKDKILESTFAPYYSESVRRHGRARLTSRWPSVEAWWRIQPKWQRGRNRRSKTRRRC